MLDIRLLPQEQPCNAQFTGNLYMTRGFKDLFNPIAENIAALTVSKIIRDRVKSPHGADYLQVVTVNNKKFWVIDDKEVVTCLLPEEY